MSKRAAKHPGKKRGFVRRWGKRLAILAVLAVPVYLVVGYLVLPAVIRSVGLPLVSEYVDGRIELDDLDLDPVRFNATVKGLRVYDRDDLKVIGVKRARVGVSWRSFWLEEGLVLNPVEAREPYASLILREDGSLNLQDVLVLPESEEPPSEEPVDLTWLPRIRLGGVDVTDGTFKFDDRLHERAVPRTVRLENLTVGPIDTGPGIATATTYSAALASDLGESATAEGGLRLDPLRLDGEAEASGLRLAAYQPYFDRFVPLTLKAGEAGAVASWRLDLTPGARVAEASVSTLGVSGFELSEAEAPGGRPGSLVGFEGLTLSGLRVDALAHRAELAGLTLDGADLTVEREADGSLPLVVAVNETVRRVNLLTAASEDAASEEPATPMPVLPPPLDAALDGLEQLLADALDAEATPWTARLGEARVSGLRARWSDAVPEGGAVLGVDPVDATAGPVDTAEQLTVPFKATIRVADASEATRAATPGQAAPEAAFQDVPEPSEAAREIRRRIAVESLAAADADLGRGLITAQGTLDVEALSAETLVVVRGLDLTGANPYLPDVVPGLKILSSSIDLRASPRLSPNRGVLPVRVEDALIRVGGRVEAQYGPPGTAPLTVPVEGIALEYGPLNTKSPVPGNLSLDAVVAGGEVGVVGTAVPRPTRPLESDLDVEVGVSGLELAPLSPLIAPFLGRAIDRGELFVAMPASLSEGRLKATVPVAIEGFKLGGKVDATGADAGGGGGGLGVPIDLVVAVLKGPNDTLVLPPIPIDFDLLDNKLNLGKAVSGAFVGVLRGVAAQPLKMLGGVATGGGRAVGQAADGIKNAAGGVVGAAGGMGRGAGNAAGAVGDAAGGLLRGVGGLMGMGGGAEAAAAEAEPGEAVPVVGGEAGAAAAEAGVIDGVVFAPGSASLTGEAREALDALSKTLNARGLGLELRPMVEPATDGPALVRLRKSMAEEGRSAAGGPVEATPRMLRTLALRRARTIRSYLLHAAEADLRLPENAVRLSPPAAETADDPAAAYERGTPGVRFGLIAAG